MRRRSARRKKKPVYKKLVRRLVLIVIVIWLVSILFLYFVTPARWENDIQFSYVYLEDENVVVRVLEPDTKTITDIMIPKASEVQVANQMGTWTLEAVWELGEDEGLDGLLLSRTLSKSFLIPIEAWSERPIDSLGAVLTSFKTNLSLKDKLRLFSFWLANKNSREVYEHKGTKLSDSLRRLLNYSAVSSELARVEIINLSESKRVENWIVSLIEVMGTKVFSISNNSDLNFEKCLVISGGQLKTTQVISRVLGCRWQINSEVPSQTVKLYIDEQFVRAY